MSSWVKIGPGGLLAVYAAKGKSSTSSHSFHCGYSPDFFPCILLPEICRDPVDNISKIRLRTKTSHGVQFFDGGHAAHHVFKSGLVGLVVGHKLDGRIASGAVLNDFGETLNAHFFGVADVNHFTDCTVQGYQAEQSFHSVPDVAEAAGLLAITVNFDGSPIERPLHKVGENHSVAPGLSRADRIEKTDNNYGLFLLLPVRKSQKFIEGLGSGVAPTPLRGGAENKVRILMKRHVGVFPVDFGSGGDQNEFLLFGGRFQNHLRPVDVRFNRPDGALHNQLHADRGGQVNDNIGVIHQLRQHLPVFDPVKMIFQAVGALQVADIFHAAGGEIIEQHHLLALFQQSLGEMGTDKSSAARDQVSHTTS